MSDFVPAYLKTRKQGFLKGKIEKAWRILENCRLCPRACGVNRLSGEQGVCQTGEKAVVSSFSPHYGEEDPLVGTNGSGTIFFSGCNLRCLFCQNFEISHQMEGEPVCPEDLARAMILLQDQGCHNINFVTPSHVVPQILLALEKAIEWGLTVPLVYNSGGYDKVETLEILDGVFDIYMPDFKFWDEQVARTLCQAPDYREIACAALTAMYNQVGELVLDEEGVARRGVLIRHLVLPEGMAGTGQIMAFIGRHLSKNNYVNIMSQYRPCGRASEVTALGRGITDEEFRAAVDSALEQGVTRLDERKRTFVLRWF